MTVGTQWDGSQSITLNDQSVSVTVKQFDEVHRPDDFIKVMTSGSRVSNGQTDDLLGVNDKDGADLLQS